MNLKIEAISNDPLNRTAVVRITEVLDGHPSIETVMKLPTTETQTQAEVHAMIKTMARQILEQAARVCE